MNPFSNKFLLATLIGVAAIHSAALYTPFMNALLRLKPPVASDWLLIFGVGLAVLGAEEIRKMIYRRNHPT